MKKPLIRLFLAFLCIFSIANCAPKQIYRFGNYSQTLYQLEKNQNEESLLKHKQVLETIISESGERNLPVPPGIYAELGYINLKTNDSKKAISMFQAEYKLYPESKLLMDRLIQSAEARDNSESDLTDNSEEKEMDKTIKAEER